MTKAALKNSHCHNIKNTQQLKILRVLEYPSKYQIVARNNRTPDYVFEKIFMI